MRKADRYYSDDITWCVSECEKDCPRKPKYIRDKTIPHSFADFSEVCNEYEPKDEPQTCSVTGRLYTDCSRCEYFKCTADEPQTSCKTCRYGEVDEGYVRCAYYSKSNAIEDEPQKIMEKCYKCKWWNYSYGCSNKKGICEFEPLKDEQSGKE